MFTEIVKNDNGKMEIVDLASLAEDINSEFALTCETMKKGIEHALKVGGLLLQAKSLVGHGGWHNWVVNNCDFTTRTASNYMALARHPDMFKSETVSDLTLRGMLDIVHAKDTETKVVEREKLGEGRRFSWEKNEEVIKAREVFSNFNNLIDLLFFAEQDQDPEMARKILDQFEGYMIGWLGHIRTNWLEKINDDHCP